MKDLLSQVRGFIYPRSAFKQHRGDGQPATCEFLLGIASVLMLVTLLAFILSKALWAA
jgi:hypothetical protein